MAKYTAEEITESIERLTEVMPKGSTVFTVVRSVSRSGMSRVISVHTVTKDGDIRDWSYNVARVLGWTLTDEGITAQGVGMDMGFYLVYTLSRALHDDGYALKQRWI